ncbi:DUF4352 domain-containing protein [Priestia megaterium]|uniref:DUF4352 domain-containing protein n=1 Tax=Priestia megaterium TaxID=1404 RepID=A0A6H1P230_PRIMG|nr:DUF4352 domain-containing protein [Priestia megaterium]QIZ07578.1 DUF4352 domain-containing protein [Priestia megaterium]
MAKLVECKACGKEIAKGVKKCPHCGKDQRSWFGRHKILSFIGAIVILGGIGSALGGGDDATSTGSKTAVEKKEATFKVGESFKTDDLEYTITKVEEKDKVGNEYLNKKVSEGGTFVAVQYTVKNVGSEPVGMFDYPSINLVDEKGTKYDSDIDASSNYAVETDIDNSKIASDLNPDIQVTDTQVYEVSKAKYAQGKWFIQVGDAKIQVK